MYVDQWRFVTPDTTRPGDIKDRSYLTGFVFGGDLPDNVPINLYELFKTPSGRIVSNEKEYDLGDAENGDEYAKIRLFSQLPTAPGF